GKIFGIDMGTSNTRIYVKGSGIKVREPSVVAVDNRMSRITAAGIEAKMMMGKTPPHITACAPIKDGVVADFDVAAGMLEYFFRSEAGAMMILSRPKVYLSVPHCATSTERRSFIEVAAKAGAKNVMLVPETLAAAVGMKLKIEEPKGKMIVNIGGGTTEASVISFGGAVLTNSIRVGGTAFDRAIMNFMRRRYGVTIGEVTAEVLKKDIGTVMQTDGNPFANVHASAHGAPVAIKVHSSDLREPLRMQASQIIECIRAAFERTPPELCSDIRESGIIITGGGACLRGLDALIEQKTGIRTYCAKKPLDSVVMGLGTIIDSGDKFGIAERTDR
ncbi:MAG: rod shape-determining protein, partial [Clostridia bacterium]|nr:rod shape-determining protein [Clostridia bacterium]